MKHSISHFKIKQLLMSMMLIMLSTTNTMAIEFDEGLIQFAMKVNHRTLYYDHGFVSVMPRTVLEIEFDPSDEISIEIAGETSTPEKGRFLWLASNKAAHQLLKIHHHVTEQTIELHVFTLKPASGIDQQGVLNGYRIGQYPPPHKGLPAYQKPNGFIEVTAAMMDLQISPHFKLGQFICKQASEFPKYMLLNPLLLDKLELMLSATNLAGFSAQSFHVMSGYRTPYYNQSIGNVKNSRHVYGGAADVFLDESPQDNYMDDLNQDGKNNIDDVNILYQIANQIAKDSKRDKLVGGIGVYKKNSVRGPFIHLDVRGTRARW